MMTNVLHISESDGAGGAARAAYRIHRSLVDVSEATGVKSSLLVRRKVTEDPTVHVAEAFTRSPKVRQSTKWISRLEDKVFRTRNPVLHSTARMPTGILRDIERIAPNIIVLHWLGNNVMSIREIGRLLSAFPTAWVLHDTWAFCGAEHYPFDEADKRFADGYPRKSGRQWERGLDINRRTWKRKQKAWSSIPSIIAPSSWMADQTRASALMRSFSVEIIPYPMKTDWWGAQTRDEARQHLGISDCERVLVFGAVGGEKDPRKGADLLRAALAVLPKSVSDDSSRPLKVLTFGGRKDDYEVGGVPVRSVGRLDDEGLRAHYTAADVTVVPSRIDNLPQTAMESVACGTPVVGFRVGGMPDIVIQGRSGWLVEPYSSDLLADAIFKALQMDSWQRFADSAKDVASKWKHDQVGVQLARSLLRVSRHRQGRVQSV